MGDLLDRQIDDSLAEENYVPKPPPLLVTESQKKRIEAWAKKKGVRPPRMSVWQGEAPPKER